MSWCLRKQFLVKLKQVLRSPWVRQGFFLCVGALLGGLAVKIYLDPPARAWLKRDYWSSLNRVGEVFRLIESKYYDQNISQFDQFADNAINGLVDSLDRHSSYFKPSEFTQFNNSMDMRYVGIGIKIRSVEEGVLVTKVFDSSPASHAQLEVGDRITKVEDHSVVGLGIAEIGNLIRGESGSEVSLHVTGLSGALRKTIVNRAPIIMPSVEEAWVDQNRTGYMRISQFSRNTEQEVESALEVMQANGMRRIILDLRDNGGGLLDSAVNVASFFLPQKEVIVRVNGRTKGESRELSVSRKDPPVEIPMVILFNEKSASGSELLAGALRQLGGAMLVGETSFGKSSVQTIFALSGGAGIRLTTSTYSLPDGTALSELGLAPDVQIPCDENEESKLDLQRDIGIALDEKTYQKLFGFSRIPDRQLERAKEIIMEPNFSKYRTE